MAVRCSHSGTLLDPVAGVQFNRGRRADASTLLIFVTDDGRTSSDPFQSSLETQLTLLASNITRFVIVAGNPNAVAVQTLAYYNGVSSTPPPSGSPSSVLDAGENFTSTAVDAVVGHLVQTTCHPCPFGQYLATQCTPTTDRTCAPWSVPCNASTRVVSGEYFEFAAPTPTTDRECQPTTRCNTTRQAEFIVSPPTLTTDRVCATVVTCDSATEFIRAQATATSQRVCYPLSECSTVFNTFQLLPPTPTTDRVCAPYEVSCTQNEFEAHPTSPTSDRVCMPIRSCLPSEYETAAPTPTTNRVCALVPVPGWVEMDGYVSVWQMNAADRRIATVLHNATLRECATRCTEIGCQSFSRGAQPLSTCILGGSTNRCGGVLVPRANWHMFYNATSCPACTSDHMVPPAQLPTSPVRPSRPSGWDDVTVPSRAWRSSQGQRCGTSPSRALEIAQGVNVSECQRICEVGVPHTHTHTHMVPPPPSHAISIELTACMLLLFLLPLPRLFSQHPIRSLFAGDTQYNLWSGVVCTFAAADVPSGSSDIPPNAVLCVSHLHPVLACELVVAFP